MSKNLTKGKVVRKSAAQIPAATAGDLERLRAAMTGKIDASKISERRKYQRLQRDSNGRLPQRATPTTKKASARKRAS